jgi:UDP-N-acetylmuramoyl-tripeptide--D-alanyl-D-alanine ligase
MTAAEIARGIGKIKPVEHRLQLVANPGGLTVIDDAFNSNIRGAEQAFLVLREMGGRRIVVTPGMVELGDREEEMNRTFGRIAADCCDLAILVGKKRSSAIADGFREKGFPEQNLLIVSNLEEAAELLKVQAKPGDTVLFENDLPDNYSE